MKAQKLLRKVSGMAIGFLGMALAFSSAYAMTVEITNINIDNFPGIHIFARVLDDSGNFIEDLSATHFELREDGLLVTESVEAQYGYMAVTLVMDESGSMQGFEQNVIDACSYFVNGLENLDKGAIVKFATTSYVDVPMTYDKDDLLASIAGYQASGTTDLWDAIYLGIQECFYEPERKAVVAFTDGQDNQPGHSAAQLPGLAGPDITIYTIGIGDVEEDSLTYVAQQTGGFFLLIDSASQMQQVLIDIRSDIEHLYDIFYTTPDPATNGTVRDLQLVCNYQGEAAWDTASYVSPFNLPPTITLSVGTQGMLGVAQPAGQSLNISCEISSAEPVAEARIYYKHIGATYFTQANLIHGAGRNYYYNIPSGVVLNPGVHFYLQATDTPGATITAPSFSPGELPLCIAVLTNYPPVITYDEPAEWLTRRSLPFEVTVTDATNYVSAVKLYYRLPHSFFYTELAMTSQENNQYYCEIEGPEINAESDLEYFIAAWDNHNAIRYWSWADEPYYLDIVNELGPTPPALVLEPQSLPIVIPVAGGSFLYSMIVLNPIDDFQETDTWADFVLPGGSIQSIGLVQGGIILPGGGSYENSYSQTVAGSQPAGDYLFRVHTGDYSTQEIYYTDSFPFTKSATTGADGFRLEEAFPNPFNAATSLTFYLPDDGEVTASIFNLFGQEVAKLADGYFRQGQHRIFWDAGFAPTGTYFCRIATDQGTLTQKIMLVK